MNKDDLTRTALKGVDSLGYQLEKLGITDRLNRHNIAAFMMAEQHHLEGQWDSLQTRLDRYRRQADGMLESLEKSSYPVLKPMAERINRYRRNDGGQAD